MLARKSSQNNMNWSFCRHGRPYSDEPIFETEAERTLRAGRLVHRQSSASPNTAANPKPAISHSSLPRPFRLMADLGCGHTDGAAQLIAPGKLERVMDPAEVLCQHLN